MTNIFEFFYTNLLQTFFRYLEENLLWWTQSMYTWLSNNLLSSLRLLLLCTQGFVFWILLIQVLGFDWFQLPECWSEFVGLTFDHVWDLLKTKIYHHRDPISYCCATQCCRGMEWYFDEIIIRLFSQDNHPILSDALMVLL